jgi:hypothetical protein
LETVFCTACGHQMANDFRFCSKCGEPNRAVLADDVPSNVPSAAQKPVATEAKTLHASTDEPSTGKNRSLALWLSGLIVVFLVVIAVLAQVGSQSRDAATSSSESTPSADWSSESSRVPVKTNDETIAACNYLGPVVEDVVPRLSATNSVRDRELALSELSLTIRGAMRSYNVEGLFSDTKVEMPLSDFLQQTENMLLFVDYDNDPLMLTRFIDSMFAAVLEPCAAVGIQLQFPEIQN